MLQRIAHLAIAAPRRIIAAAVLVMVAAGVFGIPVAKSLSAGGLQDPTSESDQATKLLVDKFGRGDMDLVISVTSDAGAQGDAARAVGTDIAAPTAGLTLCGAGDLGVDRAAVGRAGTDQQGRQDRADRRRHHRRRERRAEARQDADATNSCTTATVSRCAPAVRR